MHNGSPSISAALPRRGWSQDPRNPVQSRSPTNTILIDGGGPVPTRAAEAVIRFTTKEGFKVSCLLNNEIDPRQWDAFAQASGASYLSAHRQLRAWAIKHWRDYDLSLFEIYVDEGGAQRKIGQCAVAVSLHKRLFLDRLQLLRDDPILWRQAMSALLQELGPGHYEYGWRWSLEPPREQDFGRIEGVVVERVQPLFVHAVNFGQWPTWESYLKNISPNCRRNARRAETDLPDLSLDVRQGRRALLQCLVLLRLRSAMCRRKFLPFNGWRSAISYLGMIIRCPESTITAVASAGGRSLAALIEVEFASNTYFLEGASRQDNSGAAWYLQLAMLRRAYERNPASGKFVMGYIDYATHTEERGGGLLRSRRALRVTEYATSLVSLTYQFPAIHPQDAVSDCLSLCDDAGNSRE
jgi:hypothetical protein